MKIPSRFKYMMPDMVGMKHLFEDAPVVDKRPFDAQGNPNPDAPAPNEPPPVAPPTPPTTPNTGKPPVPATATPQKQGTKSGSTNIGSKSTTELAAEGLLYAAWGKLARGVFGKAGSQISNGASPSASETGSKL